LLTEKGNAISGSETDEYLNSKQVIDRFLLTPKQYSGREVRLCIQFDGKPYFASKKLCTAFNLEFGETVGRKIIILKPEGYKNAGLDELYASSKYTDTILGSDDRSQLDLYAKLQFADKEVTRVSARYKSELIMNRQKNISLPSLGKYTVRLMLNSYYSIPSWPKAVETRHKWQLA
jgi:hypothetical protein